MGQNPQIRATCKAIRNEQISIDLGDNLPPVTPKEPGFDRTCERILSIAEKYQRQVLKLKQPQLWNARAVRTVGAYLKKHRLAAHFRVGSNEGEFGTAPFATQGRMILLGLIAPIQGTPSQLLQSLRHEHGHIGDQALLGKHFPALQPLLDRGTGTVEEIAAICNAHIALLRAQFPTAQRMTFDRLAQEVFGDIENPSEAITILQEVLRYGEEVYGAWKTLHATRHEKIPLLHVKPPTHQTYARRLLLVAALKEAGHWETYRRRKDFDAASVADLTPEHLEFFQHSLRAAHAYFR